MTFASFSPARSRPQSGFALLVTVVLVAFLVIILVGLATFTRVETEVAENSENLSQARQNALAGLNVAIGQLQRYAGPDQRLTTRADIIAAPTNNQNHLTAVWNTNSPPTVEAWLVSGNELAPTGNTDVLAPAAGTFPFDDIASTDGEVFLLGRNSVETDAERVRVIKTPIVAPDGSIPGLAAGAPAADRTIGHYAFWVGDEGIKASLAMPDPLIDPATRIAYDNTGGNPGDDWSGANNDKRDRLNQLQLPRPRFDRLLPGIDFDTLNNAQDLARILEREQVSFLDPTPTAAARRAAFHNLTPRSEGVLVDVPRGRLKIDLSDNAGASSAGGGAYGDAVVAYRNYRVAPPTSGTGFLGTYTVAAAEPAGSIGSATLPTFSAGPVLSEFGLRFYFTLNGSEVRFHYIIEAELWNPYAAELNLPAAGNGEFSILIENLPVVEVRDTNVAGAVANIALDNVVATAEPTGGRYTLPDPALTWSAGQIRTVSGGATLTNGGAETMVNTGISLPGGTTIDEVGFPAFNNLVVTLRVGDGSGGFLVVQRYRPAISFTSGDGPNGAAYSFGYGFELNPSFAFWTDGSDASHRDPRFSDLSGDFFDPAGNWNVAANENLSAAADTQMGGRGTVALFDLPRQEIVSVGDLRHLVIELPAPLGNGWGARNDFFDRYYFSTVPRNHTWNFKANEPVPNRYIRYYMPQDSAEPVLGDLQDSQNAAKFLMTRGAFNINSTSVDAWRAVLGAEIDGWTYEGAAGSTTLDNVFFRLNHGAQQLGTLPVSGASIAAADSVNTGGRQLTSVQIDAVAGEIVDLLQDKGAPFASVEDFLNFPDPSGGTTRGVIALALERADINDPSVPADYRHTPGAVTQADIVTQIAPFINVRSDTFLVRSYGDVRNPATEQIDGRAWCEALVQRVPETVDSSDNQITPAAPFGRKFKVVAFRWLSSADL